MLVLRIFSIIIFYSAIVLPIQAEDYHLQLTAEEKQYLQQHPTIKVNTQKNLYPFNYVENGKAIGYDNDLIRLVAKKLGLQVEFMIGNPWNVSLEKLKNKEIDIISGMKLTTQRNKTFIFTRSPSAIMINGLLTRQGGNISSNFNNIKSIAVIKGFFFEELLQENYPHIQVVLTKNLTESIALLTSGKVDVVLDFYDVIRAALSQQQQNELVNIPLFENPIFSYLPKFMAFNKTNNMLRNIIDKGLMSLNKTELNELQAKWAAEITFGKALYQKDYQERLPVLSSLEQRYLSQRGSLKMCVAPNWMPIEAIVNGKHTGIAADFVRLFSERIISPIVLLPTAKWIDTLEALQSGRCDFIPFINKTVTRSEYFSFTEPYFDLPLALVSSKDNVSYKLQQVLHKPLGMLKGAAYYELLRKRYPDADIRGYPTVEAALDAVSNGEIYGFIDRLAVISNQMQSNYPELKIVDKLASEYAFSVAVAKEHPILLSIFNKVSNSISLQQKQQVLNRWLPVIHEKEQDLSIYWLVINVLLVIGVLLSLALYYTKKQKLKVLDDIKEIEHYVMRDPLSGLPNKAYLKEQLPREWGRAKRAGEVLTLLLIDVDDMKAFNAVYGREAGDNCIIKIAQCLQMVTKRSADILVRLEEDDFILLLPNTEEKGIQTVVAEIFYMISALDIEHKNAVNAEAVTISIGAACMVPNDKYQEVELTRRVEQALYQAQDQGNGQMVIYKNNQTH